MQLEVTRYKIRHTGMQKNVPDSKIKHKKPEKCNFSLFTFPSRVLPHCSPVWWILYHVTSSCKKPIRLQNYFYCKAFFNVSYSDANPQGIFVIPDRLGCPCFLEQNKIDFVPAKGHNKPTLQLLYFQEFKPVASSFSRWHFFS